MSTYGYNSNIAGNLNCSAISGPEYATPSLFRSISQIQPQNCAIIGNTLYILTVGGNRVNTYDLTTFELIRENFIANVGSDYGSMDSYGSSLYITVSTYIKVYDSVTGANTSNISVGYNVKGLFIYNDNGIMYVGTEGNNIPPVIAYNTNGTLASFFSTSSFSGFIQSITIADNILYAGDVVNERVSKYNASTGAAINLNFITDVSPWGIAIYGSTFFINPNTYNLSTGALIANSVITATSANMKVFGTRLYATIYNALNIYDFVGNININAVSGSLTCGAITCSSVSCNIPASQITGSIVATSIPAGNVTAGNLNIGSSGTINCGAITTNNGTVKVGSGTIYCNAIGLGITDLSAPTAPLDIRNFLTTGSISVAYLQRDINTGAPSTGSVTGTQNISIKTVNNILTGGSFITSSDERIKENVVGLTALTPFEILNQLEPVKYTFKDTVQKGKTEEYGFIAQKVKPLLPRAVTTNEDYVPNIMDFATFHASGSKYFITLKTKSTNTIEIKDYVTKIKTYASTSDGANLELLFTLVEIVDDKTFEVDATHALDISDLFVYGQFVKDFHLLDKAFIIPLNTACIQTLYKTVSKQSEQIDELKTQINTLMSRLQ